MSDKEEGETEREGVELKFNWQMTYRWLDKMYMIWRTANHMTCPTHRPMEEGNLTSDVSTCCNSLQTLNNLHQDKQNM